MKFKAYIIYCLVQVVWHVNAAITQVLAHRYCIVYAEAWNYEIKMKKTSIGEAILVVSTTYDFKEN